LKPRSRKPFALREASTPGRCQRWAGVDPAEIYNGRTQPAAFRALMQKALPAEPEAPFPAPQQVSHCAVHRTAAEKDVDRQFAPLLVKARARGPAADGAANRQDDRRRADRC